MAMSLWCVAHAGNQAITVGRMVAVALSGLHDGLNLSMSLRGRINNQGTDRWAIGKVVGVVYRGELYQATEEDDTQGGGGKRKRREAAAGPGRKGQKVDTDIRRPNLVGEELNDEAHIAIRIAKRHDISVRVSWWAAKGEDGMVSAYTIPEPMLPACWVLTFSNSFLRRCRSRVRVAPTSRTCRLWMIYLGRTSSTWTAGTSSSASLVPEGSPFPP